MHNDGNMITRPRDRRSFLKTGLAATGAVAVGTGLLSRATAASAQATGLTAGDAAMLRFLAAGEALEADFYTQYNELGGIRDSEVFGGTGNHEYTKRLNRIHPSFSQYIHDTGDDEISHQNFLNAYLIANGAEAVDMVVGAWDPCVPRNHVDRTDRRVTSGGCLMGRPDSGAAPGGNTWLRRR